jgi:hypothetical protein
MDNMNSRQHFLQKGFQFDRVPAIEHAFALKPHMYIQGVSFKTQPKNSHVLRNKNETMSMSTLV